MIPRLRGEVARAADSDRDDVIDARARRRAHAAAALLAVRDDAAWGQLRHSPDPGVRSYLIPRLAGIGVDPRRVIGRFRAEPDASARRALVLALGDYEPGPEWGAEREAFARDLLGLYQSDPDPGLHAAADWLLRVRWGKGAEVAKADEALAAGPPAGHPRGWLVTPTRAALVVVTGPVDFRMGSPTTEPGWSDEELAHDKRIGRSFAIGAKEVTVGQYQTFLRDRGVPLEPSRYGSDVPVGATWYEAASYCNWLSEREGLEPCYVKNAGGKYAEGMTTAPGHLGRSGYRLPTDAEWEYACRAGAATARHYGRGPALLPRYGWHLANAGDAPRPVGTLRPNDLGLFDTLGNVWEWCEEPHHHEPEKYRLDAGQGGEPLADRVERRIKGGAYNVVPLRLRAALRNHNLPTQSTVSIGFRVARTFGERVDRPKGA